MRADQPTHGPSVMLPAAVTALAPLMSSTGPYSPQPGARTERASSGNDLAAPPTVTGAVEAVVLTMMPVACGSGDRQMPPVDGITLMASGRSDLAAG